MNDDDENDYTAEDAARDAADIERDTAREERPHDVNDDDQNLESWARMVEDAGLRIVAELTRRAKGARDEAALWPYPPDDFPGTDDQYDEAWRDAGEFRGYVDDCEALLAEWRALVVPTRVLDVQTMKRRAAERGAE